MDLSVFPPLNAALNALAGAWLVAGLLCIRKRRVTAHRRCMLAATLTSALFLCSYLYYHFHAGSRAFTGQGWVRPVYFLVLISHTVLAALVPPLVVVVLALAFRDRLAAHRRWARVLAPIWLYVSLTGVIVYLMLYQLFPGPGRGP